MSNFLKFAYTKLLWKYFYKWFNAKIQRVKNIIKFLIRYFYSAFSMSFYMFVRIPFFFFHLNKGIDALIKRIFSMQLLHVSCLICAFEWYDRLHTMWHFHWLYNNYSPQIQPLFFVSFDCIDEPSNCIFVALASSVNFFS